MLLSKIREYYKYEFFRNSFILFSGSLLAYAIPILIIPILARLFSPENFGSIALYLSIVNILTVFASAGYSHSIMLPKKDNDSFNLVILSITLSLLFSSICFIILFFWMGTIQNLFDKEISFDWKILIPIGIFFTSFFQIINNWVIRKKKFKKVSINRICQTSVTAISKVSFGIKKVFDSGLIYGQIIGQFFSVILYCFWLKNDWKDNKALISFAEIKKLSKRYKKFPQFTIFTNLLNTISLQLPILMFSIFFNKEIVGFYAMSFKLLNLPLSLIGLSIGRVYFQKIAENINNSKRIDVVTLQVVKKLFLIGVFPLSAVFFFGDHIFSFVLGSKWIISGQYSQFLSWWLLFVFVSSPISILLIALEKQKQLLLFNIIIFLFRLISLLVGILIFRDAFIAIVLYGIIGAFFWCSFTFYLLKNAKVSLWDFTFYIMKIVSIAISLNLLIKIFIGILKC